MKHLFQNHDLQTTAGGEMIDLTDDVRSAVRESEVQNGVAIVYAPHTTCAVVINEHEGGFLRDFSELLETLVPREGPYYRHDDLEIRTEGLEGDPHEVPNGHAHCRAALMASSSQMIPVLDGELRLGRWQKIFFCELDRARERKVYVQVMGD